MTNTAILAKLSHDKPLYATTSDGKRHRVLSVGKDTFTSMKGHKVDIASILDLDHGRRISTDDMQRFATALLNHAYPEDRA